MKLKDKIVEIKLCQPYFFEKDENLFLLDLLGSKSLFVITVIMKMVLINPFGKIEKSKSIGNKTKKEIRAWNV